VGLVLIVISSFLVDASISAILFYWLPVLFFDYYIYSVIVSIRDRLVSLPTVPVRYTAQYGHENVVKF
jgi:hypothetical protein